MRSVCVNARSLSLEMCIFSRQVLIMMLITVLKSTLRMTVPFVTFLSV